MSKTATPQQIEQALATRPAQIIGAHEIMTLQPVIVINGKWSPAVLIQIPQEWPIPAQAVTQNQPG